MKPLVRRFSFMREADPDTWRWSEKRMRDTVKKRTEWRKKPKGTA